MEAEDFWTEMAERFGRIGDNPEHFNLTATFVESISTNGDVSFSWVKPASLSWEMLAYKSGRFLDPDSPDPAVTWLTELLNHDAWPKRQRAGANGATELYREIPQVAAVSERKCQKRAIEAMKTETAKRRTPSETDPLMQFVEAYQNLRKLYASEPFTVPEEIVRMGVIARGTPSDSPEFVQQFNRACVDLAERYGDVCRVILGPQNGGVEKTKQTEQELVDGVTATETCGGDQQTKLAVAVNADKKSARRGPKPDFENATRVMQIVERIVPDGEWHARLDEVCAALDEAGIPIPKRWRAAGCQQWADYVEPAHAVKAIEYRLDGATQRKKATPETLS